MIVLDKKKLLHDYMIDYHIHSSLTDGSSSIEELIETAIRLGFVEIGISEHVWRTSDWTNAYFEKVHNLRKRYRYPVLCGFEAKMINRRGDLDISAKDKEQADFVLGVIHRYPSQNRDYQYMSWDEITPIEAAKIETQLIINMIENETAKIIGHPTRSFYKFFSKGGINNFPDNYLERIVKTAKRYDVILEVNTKWFNGSLFKLMLKYNAKFVFGSDAHSCEEMIGHKDKIQEIITNIDNWIWQI